MNYDSLAPYETVTKVVNALKAKGYEAFVVENGSQALNKIKDLIPKGASVMNGASATLEKIGYPEYLESGKHKWVDLHAKVTAENDREKRAKLRRESALSEFYLGSVHALIENGEFIVASNTGSQLPHIVYTSPNLLFVVSTKKIGPTLSEAFRRLEEHVVPLEDNHMMKLYNFHTGLNKLLLFKDEAGHSTRKIRFIL